MRKVSEHLKESSYNDSIKVGRMAKLEILET
ncbi:hypothetical protein CDAR_44981, partial [Caerostris darwini]